MTGPTTSNARWDSQPYPPEGASAAQGIRSQLGRPALDLLTLLVREAAQNSWDARIGAPGVNVRFSLDLRTVGREHTDAWDLLLRPGGPVDDSHFPLRRSMDAGPLRVLSVSDRGTRGLGGPTRADSTASGARDFVTFIRNVGEPQDVELGGGTYGFGKGIFYMLSRPHTILVQTRTVHDGRLQTRLIGAALTNSYTESTETGDVRYTGRHWWGEKVRGVTEPLVDEAAADAASSLGLPQFGVNETGTSIHILDPRIEDGVADPSDVGSYLAETILWQLWPKMLPRTDGEARMQFDVTVEGRRYEVPDPATTHPISLFVEAYGQLAAGSATRVEHRATKPPKLLGLLGLNDTLIPPWELTPAARSAGFSKTLVHHICLMRSAELVVAYRPGVEPPAELRGYAGVFRADDSIDGVFANAEPPTHDDWRPESLPPSEKTYVVTTFRRLREIQNTITGLRVLPGVGGQRVALGAASNYFSRLVRGSTGSSARHVHPSAPGSSRQNSATGSGPGNNQGNPPQEAVGSGRTAAIRVEYVGDPRLDRQDGRTVIVQDFRLPPGTRATLRADLSIATSLDGTSRDNRPHDQPRTLGWRYPDGTFLAEVTTSVADVQDGLWQLVVVPTSDTMTAIDIRATGAPV